VGYAFNSAVVMAGFVAWGPILTAIGVEMAVFYWRRLR